MASTTTDLRLFGLDLRALWAELCAPWRGRSGALLTAWLTPTVLIRLTRKDDQISCWRSGPTPRPAGSDVRAARFEAVEIPESIVLRRELSLPSLSEDQTADAVALEAQAMSPFAVDDLVWAYHARPGKGERRAVEIVLASRKQVEQALQMQALTLKPGQQAEAWVMSSDAPPLPMVLSGFGEPQRLRHLQLLRRVCVALAALALLLCGCIAMTPTVQLWLRGKEAFAEMEALKRRAAPVVSERDAFVQSTNRLTTLSDILATRVDPLRLMDAVTKVLPDDTSVQILQVQGSKVTINGQTVNAAALMQQLSNQPGLRDVKAPSGATRPQGAQRENYVIEFTLVEPKSKPASAPEPRVAASGATVPAVAASAAASGAASAASAASPHLAAPAAASAASALPAALATSALHGPAAAKPAPAPSASPFAIGGSRSSTQGAKP